MVQGNLSVPGRPTNVDNSRARANALAVGAGGECFDIFALVFILFSFSLSGRRPDIDWNISQRAVKPKTNQPLSFISLITL